MSTQYDNWIWQQLNPEDAPLITGGGWSRHKREKPMWALKLDDADREREAEYQRKMREQIEDALQDYPGAK